MEIYLKATAGIMITLLLSLVLSQQRADFALLLTLFVCTMASIAALSYLRPVISFAGRLIQIGNLDSEFLSIFLRVTGISLITQISVNICTDAGYQTLGKTLQIVSSAVVLCICVPLLEEVLLLIEKVLGEA